MGRVEHHFNWTEPTVTAFWDRIASQPANVYQYFSLQRGRSVLEYLSKKADLSAGPIVDIGCGPGHMLRFMADKNIKCLGLDSSHQSLIQAEKNLASNPNFLGVRSMSGFDRLPLETESVGGVLLMETVEHLFMDTISHLMKEVRRVLRPNGFIFVTTPNNENIRANEVCCDACHCIFHPVQHLRSYSAKSLADLMGSNEFKAQTCEAVFFMPDWNIYLKHMKNRTDIFCPACGARINSCRKNRFRRLFNVQFQNLAFIGHKT